MNRFCHLTTKKFLRISFHEYIIPTVELRTSQCVHLPRSSRLATTSKNSRRFEAPTLENENIAATSLQPDHTWFSPIPKSDVESENFVPTENILSESENWNTQIDREFYMPPLEHENSELVPNSDPEKWGESANFDVETHDMSMVKSIMNVEPLKGRIRMKNLGGLVNQSPCLQNMVDMGVNLAKVEKHYGAGKFFLSLNWDKDVLPRVQFLLLHKFPPHEIGDYFTRNPWIFKQDLDDLQVRINYLQSKKFPEEDIGKIISNARYWLNINVKTVDKRIGWIQREFSLSGDEVRLVVARVPKLITFGTGYIQVLRFTLREALGFRPEELREILLRDPKLWMTDRGRLEKCFDYLHNTMGLSHRRIVQWPRALRSTSWFIKQRHEFLKTMGKDQYDPELPNYVSLEMLLEPNDLLFCKRSADTKVSIYNKFLKTT